MDVGNTDTTPGLWTSWRSIARNTETRQGGRVSLPTRHYFSKRHPYVVLSVATLSRAIAARHAIPVTGPPVPPCRPRKACTRQCRSGHDISATLAELLADRSARPGLERIAPAHKVCMVADSSRVNGGTGDMSNPEITDDDIPF